MTGTRYAILQVSPAQSSAKLETRNSLQRREGKRAENGEKMDRGAQKLDLIWGVINWPVDKALF